MKNILLGSVGFFLLFGLMIPTDMAMGQTPDKKSPLSINIGADLVSRYVWRGTDYGNSPGIQPSFSLDIKGFEVGAWGSYGFVPYSKKINDTTTISMGNYAEFDLFLSYTFKWFTLCVTDYFFPNPLTPNSDNKYFNWKNATTGHTIEAALSFNGTDKVPLSLYVGTLVYGADKDQDSTGVYGLGSNNNYSTYIEASYTFNIKKIGVDIMPFIGGIPFGSSWYGPYGGVINLGFTTSKEIKITPKYSLPIYVSIITNPQSESAFFVFGLTL
jgi:hypothetical protein